MKTEHLLLGTALGAALLMKMRKPAIAGPMDCPPTSDKTGERLISPRAIRHLDSCISKQPSTKEMYQDSRGRYTPERQALHQKIIKKFLWRVPCVENRNPIAVIMGGPPGAGKSTYLKRSSFKYINYANFFLINADDVRELLPEYTGWNSSAVHEEASDITKELIAQVGLNCRQDIIWDGTLSKSDKYIEITKRLHGLGYKVYVIYIQVPKEVSIERAYTRYKGSGRYVPLNVIEDHFSRGLNPLYKLVPYVDGWKLIDGITGREMDGSREFLPEQITYQ